MVHWGWLVMAFAAGAFFGMFLLALAEVSRKQDDEGRDRE